MTEKETYRGEKILILILMLAASASGWFMYNAVDLTGPQIPPEKGDPLYIMSHSPSQLLDSVDVDHLTSRNATVFDLENSKVIYSKAANRKTRPASLTKMMTCLVAIENIKDLNDKFTFSSKLINKLDGTGLAVAGFKKNETVSCKTLLYGTMLPSGADCACALAKKSAGSEKKFVALMNKKAKKLKMSRTHFSNPVGSDSRGTYTTTNDLTKLLKYALKNKTFRKVFTSKKHKVPVTNITKKKRILRSTVFGKIGRNAGYIKGGKTGTTGGALNCLATLASLRGNEYICITTYAKSTAKDSRPAGTDAKKVYSKIDRRLMAVALKYFAKR